MRVWGGFNKKHNCRKVKTFFKGMLGGRLGWEHLIFHENNAYQSLTLIIVNSFFYSIMQLHTVLGL